MAHGQRDFELYESHNLSPFSSPEARGAEFFSPEVLISKGPYNSLPSRHLSVPSTINSSRMSGDVLERVKSRERQMLWGTKIHWFLPSSMVALLLLGFMGSIAHHWFYMSLDGKEAIDQLTKVRFGTALAFFTKAMLVGSVVIAYRQRVWHTLRAKHITLRGIDGMFAVVEDPTRFATKEIFVKAKLATAMALATWIIPLASVLSPAALTTVMADVQGGNSTCQVPTLNFTAENFADWRVPKYRDGDSLAFWNTTPPYEVEKTNKATDWFDQPSYNAFRIFTLASLGHTFIPMKSPCPSFNCTWSIKFDGPWYSCSEQTRETFEARGVERSNYTYESLAPVGEYVFFGENDSGEYERPQMNYNSNVLTTQGVFAKEPKLWFGWAENTTVPLSNGSEYKDKWDFELKRHLLQCELQKVKYEVQFEYKNNVQINKNISVTGGIPINPENGDGIRPSNPNYREYSAYHALGQLTRKQVIGSIKQGNRDDRVRTFSPISQTKLVNPDTAYVQANLKDSFQTYFAEIVISLLSEQYLEISAVEMVNCSMFRYQNNFRYERTSLWIGYAISIAMALASIIVGAISLISNGITSDTTFSKILVTTRNKTIDKLVEEYEGVCLGGDPFPKELEQTLFKFGVIDEMSTRDSGKNSKHAAFGTIDEVIPIQKGDSYARLSATGSHYQSSNSWVPRSSGESSPGINTRYARPV